MKSKTILKFKILRQGAAGESFAVNYKEVFPSVQIAEARARDLAAWDNAYDFSYTEVYS